MNVISTQSICYVFIILNVSDLSRFFSSCTHEGRISKRTWGLLLREPMPPTRALGLVRPARSPFGSSAPAELTKGLGGAEADEPADCKAGVAE